MGRTADVLVCQLLVVGELFVLKHDLQILEAAAVVQLNKAECVACADISCPAGNRDGLAVKCRHVAVNFLDCGSFHIYIDPFFGCIGIVRFCMKNRW